MAVNRTVLPHKHYWLTPPELFRKLEAEFQFNFDPCPHPRPPDFDGLKASWGKSNWVNPPFVSRGCAKCLPCGGRGPGITAWVRRAIAESKQGKLIAMVFPVDKWLLMLLQAGAEVRNLGDVRWCAIEDGEPGKGIGRPVALFILKSPRHLHRSRRIASGRA